MEEVVERTNLKAALRRVKQNKGGPGVDAMTVGELPDYLKREGERIRGELLAGGYRPQPGEKADDPEGGRGRARAGHPDRAGPIHPAGTATGPATAFGSELLRPQLRVSAGAACAPGDCPRAAIRAGRTQGGGGHRYKERARGIANRNGGRSLSAVAGELMAYLLRLEGILQAGRTRDGGGTTRPSF